MSKFSIFNMTDGIPSGGGQLFETMEKVEEWVTMERAKHMELPPVGKYKTSKGEYIHPADVMYEAVPVDDDDELEADVDTPNGVYHTTELSAYGTTLKSPVRIVIIDRDGMPITALADRIEEETGGTTVITGAVCDAESVAQECMENMFQGVQFKIGHDSCGDFLEEWNGRGLMWNKFREWVTGYIKLARIRTRKDTNE